MQNCAYLSCSGKYSEFEFNEYSIRFRTSSHLRKYTEIKTWDNGYLVVTADYDTTGELEEYLEEYIDLIPMLNNLFIEPEHFLPHIREVRLKDA